MFEAKTDWRAHYAAVRARIVAGAPPPKLPSFGEQIIVTRKDRLRGLIREVALAHRLTPIELLNDRRYACVQARYELYFRARHELGYTLTPLGEACGGVDHTTVRYGIARVAALLARGGRMLSAPSVTGVEGHRAVHGSPVPETSPEAVGGLAYA